MAWTPVAIRVQVPANRALSVEVARREGALFLSHGEPVILDATCPHQGGDMAGGVVRDGCLACPLHAWRYDRTGKLVEIPSRPDPSNVPAGMDLQAFPTATSGGLVWASLEGGPPPQLGAPPHAWSELSPREPLRAWWRRWAHCVALPWLQPSPWDDVALTLGEVRVEDDALHYTARGVVDLGEGADPALLAAMTREAAVTLRRLPGGVVAATIARVGTVVETWWAAVSIGPAARVWATLPAGVRAAAFDAADTPRDPTISDWIEDR